MYKPNPKTFDKDSAINTIPPIVPIVSVSLCVPSDIPGSN